ncbi:MAG TPA: hypothetical protein DCL38_01610 [Lachnospiraceae bacterium]|nr:hypothetical protein [Lachnospiraceae bacterium]
MKKINRICVVVLLVVFVTGLFSCRGKTDTEPELTMLSEMGSEADPLRVQPEEPLMEESQVLTVTVYVCGEVKAPGVYELSGGARIVDALKAAGGFTDKAAVSYLNQAELVSDGQKIYVPSEEELLEGSIVSPAAGAFEKTEGSAGLVNINLADKAKLMTITGVGEAKADKIIAYREQSGSFKAIEDIMNVPGIKEGMFNKIKDQICVK